jgi:hypothetical protein
MQHNEDFKFENLVGRTLTDVLAGKEMVTFTDDLGNKYEMYHSQDCCESVWLDDECGSWDDILGEKLLGAYENSMENANASESGTWTFYTLVTFKGSMTLRWCGESNGYYSEGVDFYIVRN